jgi:predicted nucleotidyltransferase
MELPLDPRGNPAGLDPAVAREALAELGQILEQGLGGRARLLLFGSWSNGTATRLSDIDIAVVPEEPLPPQLIPLLRERIEESRVPYRVDLVDLSAAEPAFRARVLREGVAWTA